MATGDRKQTGSKQRSLARRRRAASQAAANRNRPKDSAGLEPAQRGKGPPAKGATDGEKVSSLLETTSQEVKQLLEAADDAAKKIREAAQTESRPSRIGPAVGEG